MKVHDGHYLTDTVIYSSIRRFRDVVSLEVTSVLFVQYSTRTVQYSTVQYLEVWYNYSEFLICKSRLSDDLER